MAQPARQRIFFDEYVRMEEMSAIRHEWLDGAVWAMAGGTPEHSAVAVNVCTLLSNQLRGKPCRVFSSDLRVRVKATGLGTYPDASVVCGKVQLDPEDARKTTAVNPKVVIEVLSTSTERYDRGEKLDHYKKIPSLEEIVLVSHQAHSVEVHRRGKSGWKKQEYRSGTAELKSIECELPLDEVYRNPLDD
jgi:Uma2 family endonuclease